MIDAEKLKKNIEEIQERIEKACLRSGRKSSEVKLLGATKGVDINTIRLANEFGIKIFGENRVQEFLPKYNELPHLEWHFIGRLQTNKIKYIYDKVLLIHSIEKVEQIQELEKRCSKAAKKIDVLIEVNVGGEESKGGVLPDNVEELIENIYECKYVNLKGFMTIPPIEDDEKKLRQYFRKMKEIFENYKKLNYNNVKIEVLSMGMSNDFEVAIEEGATLVRIGTKLFGERPKT
ncbi:YggS family pyridoxal phosphate-dependent enzyme [Caldicellulosiruptor changbaiensis]|uniref:Pyridoxal phosphate homeostasis protein n=1 Tax=Caldicellulosiruptor changbaiensis TaxID=1222016 RepID=A0A3T0D5P4_9FIRM|nr:YggS family pyridoxal phosphate-dependent enzyme [Caldicellulosiruptor changbaiensis]AZT90364.1 YggS family pyridoxal phosphate-dependent enzyme [Caldicellulosiruptor changbaiensis]